VTFSVNIPEVPLAEGLIRSWSVLKTLPLSEDLTSTDWPATYGRTKPSTCSVRPGTVTASWCTTNASGM
jgi:hypothetical protein